MRLTHTHTCTAHIYIQVPPIQGDIQACWRPRSRPEWRIQFILSGYESDSRGFLSHRRLLPGVRPPLRSVNTFDGCGALSPDHSPAASRHPWLFVFRHPSSLCLPESEAAPHVHPIFLLSRSTRSRALFRFAFPSRTVARLTLSLLSF